MKRNIDMLNGPLFKGILSFAIPVILTNLLQILFNTADLIVVGQYCGSLSVAAVSATTSLTHLIVNFFIGFSVGTGVAVARSLGAGKSDVVQRTVHTAIPTAAICGGIVSFVGVLFSPTFLKWMDTPENVLALSSVYMRIYFAGMIFNMLYNFSASILRAAGETKLPLFFLTVSGVLNVALNLFFVIVLKIDVAGVALATTISQAVSAVLTIMALIRRTDACRLLPRKIRIYPKELSDVIRLGLPAGLQSSMFQLSNVLITSSINSFHSDAVISGNGATQSIEGLLSSVTGAFSTTVINFIGQNSGAHRFDRVKKIYRTSMACMAVIVITTSTLIYLFREPLLSLYITDNPDALIYGVTRMHYISCLYFLLGLMDISTGALRGLGYSFVPMIVTLMGACGLRILWIYTIFQKHHTLACLYQSYPVSWILTFLVEAALFLFICNKKQKAENTLPQRSTL